jgi:hypothetical protein
MSVVCDIAGPVTYVSLSLIPQGHLLELYDGQRHIHRLAYAAAGVTAVKGERETAFAPSNHICEEISVTDWVATLLTDCFTRAHAVVRRLNTKKVRSSADSCQCNHRSVYGVHRTTVNSVGS